MPRGLLAKLTLVLALLMLAVGAFTVLWTLRVNRMYLAEMQQQINREVAAHIVADEILLRDGAIDHDALRHVFHMMMVIHPSIELYLLDDTGRILAFSAPEGRVKAASVQLEPLRAFLQGARLPILGDDPRHPGSRRPFSAAEIRQDGALQGYLYIVVGGEPFASAVSQLAGSYVTRLGVGVLLLGQLLALVTGFVLVRRVVRRLGSLRDAMRRFEASGFHRPPEPPAVAADGATRDEIDQLRSSFAAMSRRMADALREVERADAQRRELIASVSHDLRTPLASMRGYLETLTLQDDRLSADERRRCIEIAQRQGARLQRRIDDLFELSKLEARQVELRTEPFSIAELIQDVVQKFQPEAGRRGIRLRADLTDAAPTVAADLALIERVLDNLLENALKYTADGGTIEIATRPQGSAVAVTVRDDGCGIPEEELPRIFDRFYRGRAARAGAEEGSGLGLAIAARILELHASRIQATSRPGRGTAFRFELPSKPPDAAAPM